MLPEYYASDAGKRGFVGRLFDASAPDYDRVDRLLALGSGSRYRRAALLRAGLAPGMRMLDVAAGTGLVAREAVRIVGDSRDVVGVDPSAGMMAAAGGGLALVQGRAEQLPFADRTFDFLALGYALRHLADLAATFREFRRVLRPGGRLLLLEITPPKGALARAALRMYMRGMVPWMSRVVARRPETPLLYRYYWDTIEACVPPAGVLETLRAAGFSGADRIVKLGIFSEFRAAA
jgi:demethylmenaquinone methyltransferase/2-methoxy-6-polyprenyl-1,4-benzoquinol methylase